MSLFTRTAALVSLLLTLGTSLPLYAADEPQSASQVTETRAQLKQEIVKEVLEELRTSGALHDSIQQGIQEWIHTQQQARAEARKQQLARRNRMAQNVRPVSAERDHIYGNPDAVISLIEYSDFECPYCKLFHTTAKKLVDSSNGKVNWVYRHFPLPGHQPGAQREAEAAECIAALGGDDAFWAYADAVFERTKSGGNGFPKEALEPLAEKLGVDGDKFSACMESGRFEDRVMADLTEGTRIGITGTPGNILVNNQTGETLVRAGAQPLTTLQQAVDQLLKKDDEES